MSTTARSVFVYTCFLVLSACGMEGPMGPPGQQGPKGDQGVPGINGSGLESARVCTGSFSAMAPLNLELDVYTFADRSVLTTCSVWGPAIEARGVNMWKATQSGASLGGCLVAADADSGSYGFWNFSLSTQTTATARYTDAGSTYDGRTATLTCIDR